MKRLILSILPLLVGCALSAQTYHDGVWYSLYDEEGFELNTISHKELTLFAPTNGSFTFVSTYNKLAVNVFPKCKTYVYESANGGSSSSQIGQALPDVELSWTYGHFGESHNNTLTCSRNINWLKFDRSTGNTHVHKIQYLRISLAQHILLASGDYGTTSASYDFGEQNVLSTSESYQVNLRSFLSAGDITVTSSNPEIFHIGSPESTEPIVYAVGANACASANGTADAASGASLGKIDNYAFPVYFTPKKGGSYTGTITLTDGVSTATITLSGTGRKLDQTITWDPETTLLSSESIAPATASSELEVTYTFAPEGIVTFADGVFSILKDGEVTITAAQSGNEIYNAAESVAKTFTIHPAVTYNTYKASVCEGEAYNDAHFGVLTEEGLYTDTIPNAFGGDSIISLSLYIHPLFASEETSSHYLGLAGEWQGVNLSLLPQGDTTLVAAYSSAYGCDSTYTLHLSVLPNPTVFGADTLDVCDGDSVFFHGRKYTADAVDSILLEEKNIFGGDSIVVLVVNTHPLYLDEAEQTIMVGDTTPWQGIDLRLLPLGDTTLVAAYSSAYGCDSVYTLHLSVIPRPTTYGKDTLLVCAGETVEYNGKTYKRSTQEEVVLPGANIYGGDSIVSLVVTVLPAMRVKSSLTITEGAEEVWQDIDLSLIPAGDTTLTVTYPTIHGCDSTFILNLTVIVATPTGIHDVQEKARAAEKFFLNGQLYIRKDERLYTPQGALIETKKED